MAAHVRQRLVGSGAQRLEPVGVDHDELAPGRREPPPRKLRAGERNGDPIATGAVRVGREPGRPLQHGARRAGDRARGVLGGRHRLEEPLGVADDAPAEIAARDDDPAVIVSAPHRIRGESSGVGVLLEDVQGLVADNRLRDRNPGALTGSSSTAYPSRSAAARNIVDTDDARRSPRVDAGRDSHALGSR
jgi:hypothetical protein